MVLFMVLYMIGLTIISGMTLLKYIFKEFNGKRIFLKLLVIVSNIIVLGYNLSGVYSGLTLRDVRFLEFDDKEIVLENLYSITSYAVIISTIFFIISRILIYYIRKKEEKEFNNRVIRENEKAWEKFFS